MKKKNLNVPLTKHNKDKKIKKIYKKFAKTLFLNIEKEKFCIAVSGGPDSLSLSYLSYCYAKKYNIDFKALIVNHNLRKYSLKEANLVRSILSGIGISSKILSWQGKIPKSNIQLNARKIRYFLLQQECNKLKINNLLLGHQNDDFAENFFIRLFRGSGLKGLSSFNTLNFYGKSNIKLIRPLIDIKKDDLIYISKKIFGIYISDPSNFDKKFLRTRVRKYIKIFKSEGLDLNKINLTIKNLQLADKSIDYFILKSESKYSRQLKNNNYLLSKELFFNEGDEIKFRILGKIITQVGEKYYPPRGKDLRNLINNMESEKFKKSTLGNCIVEKLNNSFIVKKEG